jgi:hypothetical protein
MASHRGESPEGQLRNRLCPLHRSGASRSQQIAVAGKPLEDRLAAIDHFDAIRSVRDRARRGTPLCGMDVRSLHRLVVLRSKPDIAGRYVARPNSSPLATRRW